jgi:hypothetical protein
METTNITLNHSDYAYLFGFIQTDGNLYNNTRDRGRLSIEIHKQDEDILWAFQNLIPFNSSIMEVISRSRNSIQLRLWRLNKLNRQLVTN